jgi:4-amino-4-deoxy-L-arabinose transferase-like glycosyltransferase
MGHRLDRTAAGVVLGSMLLAATLLFGLYDRNLFTPDAFQLLDAARHLLAGDGYSSSIIFYEAQLQFARVPAPLTVWPPGLSWLVLLPMWLGLSGELSAFALCVIAHLATTWLVFVMAKRLAGSWIAAVAAIAWLFNPVALMMVLALYAEPIFIAFMVASYFLLVEANQEQGWSTSWLLAAGAAAACSILMRYVGVLWPVAAGLWLLLVALQSRSWQPIRAAFIFGALPALTTAALFLRNFLLTDRFSGGQFEYGGAGRIVVVMRHFLWDVKVLLGQLLRISPIVFTVVIVTLGLATFLIVRRSRPGEPRHAAVGLAISNIVVLVAFLVGSAIASSMVFMDYRYLLPGLPFLAIMLSPVTRNSIDAIRARVSTAGAIWPATIIASCALLAISVLAAFPERWPIRKAHPSVAVVEQALAERMRDGRTLRETLAARADKPLLTSLEHLVAAQTGRAVIGLVDARFSKRLWTSGEVEQLVARYGIEQVVFFPQGFVPRLAENANQQFWNELLAGHMPPWLKQSYVSDRVILYDVIPAQLREHE